MTIELIIAIVALVGNILQYVNKKQYVDAFSELVDFLRKNNLLDRVKTQADEKTKTAIHKAENKK